MKLGNTSILRHTVKVFLRHKDVDEVRVVIHKNDKDLYERATKGLDLPEPIIGGETRQNSVFEGLKALKGNAPELVLIHDAARPFVSVEVIDNVIAGLKESEAVIPAISVADTIKRVEGDKIAETVNRSDLVFVQTPQGFKYNKILEVHEEAEYSSFPDDAALLEANGVEVKIAEGSSNNFKITTKEDLERAQKLVEKFPTETRVGTGFDVHAFEERKEDNHVMLCGVRLEHSKSLKGHSDADVGIHAIVDAILGAIGEGDIGKQFPDNDDKWEGADSSIFLKKAVYLASQKDAVVTNIDVTIICEEPKISPNSDKMVKRIAEITNVDEDRINIKGTTTEKLGITGKGDGIAAEAAVSVEIKRG